MGGRSSIDSRVETLRIIETKRCSRKLSASREQPPTQPRYITEPSNKALHHQAQQQKAHCSGSSCYQCIRQLGFDMLNMVGLRSHRCHHRCVTDR